ncbi:LysM peptidoglycan-binding domain-containing protein [Jeotgalibacillus terrae]|uniref:LysM peptidoglycan-binding domain-containing protein n=1 Tax=Jeotgalibacillus terrae TaxID=587735 RepID=A0ABW5ZBV0_9BACL|nr:LysM peptidoglycan-binding domain-containing protein [Jeotgalibacillus terrae]MBM7577831.1 LysM repeat protein [Jeotgalibacillus terrae]
MKKWFYTAAATIAVAAFGGTDSEAQASTYTVSSGDSLWKIANKYQTSVDHIKKLNNLSSELIRPNQILKISSEQATFSAATAPSGKSTGAATMQAAVYIVQPGDTLSAISAKTGTKLADLTSLNQLLSHIIHPGQSLKLKGAAPVSQPVNTATLNVTADSTYIVKSGDTLSKIAAGHGISLAKLMELNGLSGHIIYAGQKLTVDGQSATAQQSQPNVTVQPAASDYIVKSGDTLSKIAVLHKMSLSELKNINQLSSDMIRVGQKLRLKGSVQPDQSSTGPVQTSQSSENVTASVSKLLAEAQSHLGTPYAWGGTAPGGFDCSGFIYYVHKQAGFDISRTNSEGQHARSFEVSNPQPGDLVFFENTYKQGISHVGIYIGGNQFIHAGDNGVTISSLDGGYWQSKFESFKRFYN